MKFSFCVNWAAPPAASLLEKKLQRREKKCAAPPSASHVKKQIATPLEKKWTALSLHEKKNYFFS